MPLYLKSHSYGEYVFDWAWADAYRRNGLDYYPKLLSAIPFTPVTGPRLLAKNDEDRLALAQTALTFAMELKVSSLHILFPTENEAKLMEGAGMLLRHGVQFHWNNGGYGTFDDFLAVMSHDKRKKVKQERRKVRDAGIEFEHLVGKDITPDHWRFFHDCYVNTYRLHHSTPYLNLEFFTQLGEKMPENVLLVLAKRDGKPIASALNMFSGDKLFGRYWGAMEFHSGLHFEACYYQAIEFCINRGIKIFEGGAQGEHKIARGLLPIETWSAHWLADPRFFESIGRYLNNEAEGVSLYVDELNERKPFKEDNSTK